MILPKRRFDFVLNLIALAIAVTVLAVFTWQHAWQAPRSLLETQPLRAGDKITALSGDTWQGGKPILIIAMQVGCHWCEQSAGFYRELLKADANGAFHVIVAFPQETVEAQAFLGKIEIKAADIRKVDFARMGVGATPTVILADQSGRIISDWVGYQNSAKEDEIFVKLGVIREHPITRDEPLRVVDSATPVTVGH